MPIPLFSFPFDFGRPPDLAAARKAFEGSANDPGACYRYANALAANGQHPLAVEMFLAAADGGGDSAGEATLRAGVCMLYAGAFGEAALTLETASAALKERWDLQLFLGAALFHLGVVGRANTHWWAASRMHDTAAIRDVVNRFLSDDDHPERLALYPICIGKGIDVGCGNRKTHPDAIGIDLIPPGAKGTAGCVRGRCSVADVVASGDLPMFADDTLDYVVLRHNLEHYQDFIKAIQEWKRVLKPGGLIGMVVPDDERCDTIRLDPTHKHVFTQASLARAVKLIGGLRLLRLGPLLKEWSFLCVAKKAYPPGGDGGRFFDYEAAVAELEQRQVLQRARGYETAGDYKSSSECRLYARRRFPRRW